MVATTEQKSALPIERALVAKEDQWNVEALYPSLDAFEQDLAKAKQSGTAPFWPKLAELKGRLGQGPQVLKAALDELFKIERNLSRLYTYAHLRHDEDIADDTCKTANTKATLLFHDFALEASWFEPELLALSNETLEKYLNDPSLSHYKFHIEKIIRVKKHTLSPENEELMAMSAKALQAVHNAFSAINDADFKFGFVEDSKKQKLPLSHATYALYIRDRDRDLRKNVFHQYHEKYNDYENTLCELLQGQIASHQFNAKARHFSSCLEAALFPKNIDVSVYTSLIKAVNEEIGALHDYYDLRQQILGVDKLHLYDMSVPLTESLDIRMSYSQAEKEIVEAVKPLGEEYQSILRKGLLDERWVDRYENKNKRSGAYSSGCYDSHPYMLMNYKDILRDVFTLAHEAGHSMHSYLTHANQPFQYGNYPIFLAEVASTFNEELLSMRLLEKSTSKQEKIFLINQKLEDIRGTLFRQTMFAEFELFLHSQVEKGVPLTPALLKDQYLELNRRYFGPKVEVDEAISIEWARIPHFYYNFYVFQYATGISAALALADKVVNGGQKEREDYLGFLKAGCSAYPIDILKNAGVDMRGEAPVKAAINRFRKLTNELKALC